MQTKNIIQSTANVIKVTNLVKGDIIKKIDTNYSSKEIKYAVVLDILNDGDNTFIEMLEYKKSYNEIDAEIQVYSGQDDVALFPASLDDVQKYFSQSLKSIKERIVDKKKELYELEKGLEKAEQFVSGELSKKLSVPEFVEMSQKEFDEKKVLKEAEIKKLQE